MIFGVNTAGDPWDIVLHGGPDSTTYTDGNLLLNYRTLVASPEWLNVPDIRLTALMKTVQQ